LTNLCGPEPTASVTMTEPDHPRAGPATRTPFTISDPATIIQRAFAAKVSAKDLERAYKALHARPLKDPTDIAARVVCLIELFGEADRRQVTARVAAIDWRCIALARLASHPEFKNWSLSDATVPPPALLQAAATEPLIEINGEPGFDAGGFSKRLRLH
jgi:hypothetical protein